MSTPAARYRLGRRIQKRRTELGLNQKQLADAAGISGAALSRIESGQRAPSLDTLRRLRSALALSDDEFLSWVEAA